MNIGFRNPLLNQNLNLSREQNSHLQKENIGPNQLIVLKTIQKSGLKFLVELASQLQIPKTAIDRSLWALNSRGFIKREK